MMSKGHLGEKSCYVRKISKEAAGTWSEMVYEIL